MCLIFIDIFRTGTYPKCQIDHIDGVSVNNRFSNLRELKQRGNKINKGLDNTNTSGIKGVSWHKQHEKWQAQIKVNFKFIHLGLFETKLEAAIARRQAEIKYGFDKYQQESSAQTFINSCMS
jgi:hypothetical protein